MMYDVYEIPLSEKKDGEMASNFDHQDVLQYLPYIIVDKNENLYLVIHGNKNSTYGVNEDEFNPEVIRDMYTGVAKMFNYDTVNIICCNGYYMPEFFSNIGVNFRVVFPSKYSIYVEYSEDKMIIYVKDEIPLNVYYKDIVKYVGKKEYFNSAE